MVICRSKITVEGRTSMPAEVRRKLGIGPGDVLVWEEANGEIVVRRAVRHSSIEIHQALFGAAVPTRKSAEELKQGIRRHMRKRHAPG